MSSAVAAANSRKCHRAIHPPFLSTMAPFLLGRAVSVIRSGALCVISRYSSVPSRLPPQPLRRRRPWTVARRVAATTRSHCTRCDLARGLPGRADQQLCTCNLHGGVGVARRSRSWQCQRGASMPAAVPRGDFADAMSPGHHPSHGGEPLGPVGSVQCGRTPYGVACGERAGAEITERRCHPRVRTCPEWVES